MTTIYTKPQIDAMAVKIGVKIKEAKTTVTQSQGQSTTYAVSQKMITDSLSAFGTAAYKNVGTAAGNVMEVGAFGLGPNAVVVTDDTSLSSLNKGFITIGNQPAIVYGQQYGSYYSGILRLPTVGQNEISVSRVGINPQGTIGGNTDRIIVYTTANVTKDANGFLRDSNSIAETVVADATGNVAVASIQAGIGAPKLAYKKLTGTTLSPETQIAHGLNPAKILNVSSMVLGTDGAYYMSEYFESAKKHSLLIVGQNIVVMTAVGASVVKDRPITILITYEVD